MATSILPTTVTDIGPGRKITCNGESLALASMNVQCAVTTAGRQDLYYTWVFTFSGTEIRSGSTPNLAFHVLRNKFMQGHRDIVIEELNGASYRPAIKLRPLRRGEPVGQVYPANAAAIELVDVQGGPYVTAFNVGPFMGKNSFTYSMQVKVVTAAKDAGQMYKEGRELVLGMEISSSYLIDENHFTTRKVSGVIHLARKLGQEDPWTTDGMGTMGGGPDGSKLRALLVQELPFGQFLKSTITVPRNAKRIQQNFLFDPSNTQMTFEITDVEVNRVLPYGVTSGTAKYRVKHDGLTFGDPMQVSLSGIFKGPRSTSKELLMRRVLDVAGIMLGTDLSGFGSGRLVTSMEYEVSLFEENYIEFAFQGLVNFGKLVEFARTSNADQVLGVLGLGYLLGNQLDQLSNNGFSTPPPLFGTLPLAGDGYNLRVASPGEALQTASLSSQGGTGPNYYADNLFAAQIQALGRELQAELNETSNNVVSLEPGQITILPGRRVSVIATRDNAVASSGSRPTAIQAVVEGDVGRLAFAGIRIVQNKEEVQGSLFASGIAGQILPKSVVDRLAARYGTLKVVETWSETVTYPVSMVSPQSQATKMTGAVWVFYVNDGYSQKVRQQWSSREAMETAGREWLAKRHSSFVSLPSLIEYLATGR